MHCIIVDWLKGFLFKGGTYAIFHMLLYQTLLSFETFLSNLVVNEMWIHAGGYNFAGTLCWNNIFLQIKKELPTRYS